MKSYAYGAAYDNPDQIVAVVCGGCVYYIVMKGVYLQCLIRFK